MWTGYCQPQAIIFLQLDMVIDWVERDGQALTISKKMSIGKSQLRPYKARFLKNISYLMTQQTTSTTNS